MNKNFIIRDVLSDGLLCSYLSNRGPIFIMKYDFNGQDMMILRFASIEEAENAIIEYNLRDDVHILEITPVY